VPAPIRIFINPQPTKDPGYARFDMAVKYNVTRGLFFTARAINLFDKQYQDAFGYPPGSLLHVGPALRLHRKKLMREASSLVGPGSPGPSLAPERELPILEPILFCWSGGKDSALALYTLLQQSRVRIVALLTTVTEGYDRISMHGVRRELLQQQAKSLHLPLREVFIPPQCVNPITKPAWKKRCSSISNKVSVVLRSATSSSKTSASTARTISPESRCRPSFHLETRHA